jgi:hypothetical protein
LPSRWRSSVAWIASGWYAFAALLRISTAAGDAYTFRELAAMHREAGFVEIQAHPVTGIAE